MQKMRVLAVLAAVVALAVCVPSANASLTIAYQYDGGVLTTLATGSDTGPIVFSGLVGAFNIQVLAGSSNSPGTPTFSKQSTTNLTITNTAASVNHTIELFVTAQNFTAPVTPPDITFESAIGGSVAVARTANALSFYSCVDTANSTQACPSAIQTPTLSPAVTAVGSFDDDNTINIASLAATYALGEYIKITLGGGGELGFQASSTLSQTAVPEPMSIGLLGGAILLIGRSIRKRRAQV